MCALCLFLTDIIQFSIPINVIINQTNSRFNDTYYWLNTPVGALFITGAIKLNFNNKPTYRMGSSLSQITMSGFYYDFIYDQTDYKMCVHSIFAPPEFLVIYSFNANQASNPQLIQGTWSLFKLDQLQVYSRPSVYLAGFASYKQESNTNQILYIDMDFTSKYSWGSYPNYFLWQIFQSTYETSIIRIQYVPFSCNTTLHTLNFTNTTGTFCQCLTGYYFADYTQLCQQCSDQCFGCQQSANNCNQCGINQTLIEISPGTHHCQCNSTYYLTQGTVCQHCDPSCINCEISSSNCTSCGLHQFLQNNQCCCNDGYYLVIGTQCAVCNNSCVNCAIQPASCTSCGLYQRLNDNKCFCTQGYYLKSGTECGQCDYSCLTCQQTYNICTSCGLNAHLYQNNCNCDPGYFHGEVTNCLQCDVSCRSCLSLNICTSCQPGYYLNLASCPQCDKNCLTCWSISTNCKTCKVNANLNDRNQCICNQGYFMDTFNNCHQCHISCQSCSGPSNSQCSQCYIENILINNYCLCPDSYYMDYQGSCQKCNEECATCSDDSSCLTCKSNLNNYFNEGQCLSCKEKAAMNVDICNYADCTDQVWTKGEQCDDGNDIDRDGCSNCQIDTNYKCINIILEKSFCYTCSKGCLHCGVNKEKLVTCQQCQDGYYLNNNQCLLCSANCVTCSSFRQCLTCSVMGYQPDSNGRCPQCEDNAGFYTIGNQCQSKCGDFIIAGTEDCDDGNLMNGDGCSQDCSLEYGYILQNRIPYQIPVPNSLVQYVNSTSRTNLIVDTYQNDTNMCSALKITIENYNSSAYNYVVSVLKNTQTDSVSCQISFNFSQSLNSSQSIHFQIPYFQQSSRRLLDYLYREVVVIPRNIIVYSQSQIDQAQSVQGTSKTFTFLLYFIGPGTVILGGFECFFRILDILAWINNLYFINIQYPLNIQVFFQNSGLASFQLIPQFITFNQPEDPYYTESPMKFMELGVDPLFINNAYQSLSIILVIVASHIVSRISYQIIQLCVNPRNSRIQIQSTINNNRTDNKYIIALKNIEIFNKNIISHFIKGLNLTFLDLVLAFTMQLLYFQLDYLKYSEVLISAIFALISIFLVCFIIILNVIITNKHAQLLSAKSYIQKYGVLYEDINKQSGLALKYSVFNLLRKTSFIINLLIFYDNPLFQTLFSTIITLINIVLILYENPFENRKAFVSNFIPDFCIFGLMLITSILALDDQVLLSIIQDQSIKQRDSFLNRMVYARADSHIHTNTVILCFQVIFRAIIRIFQIIH